MGVAQLSVQMAYFGTCYTCGVPVYGPEIRYKAARDKGASWYCINGHATVFRESETDLLRKQLERATKEKEWAEQAAKTARHAESTAKGKLKAQTERVKNGVCPCCNRTFQNLGRHMATKHPEFGDEK
jgi:hypothetical protein